MTKRYYKVDAKCGHVGRNKCIWITFAVAAENGKDAAKRVRNFKRVKHDRPDAIRSVKEISFEEFMILKAENDADPYLHCKNIQEQRKIPNFDERVVDDTYEHRTPKKHDKLYRRKLVILMVREADLTLKQFEKAGDCI